MHVRQQPPLSAKKKAILDDIKAIERAFRVGSASQIDDRKQTLIAILKNELYGADSGTKERRVGKITNDIKRILYKNRNNNLLTEIDEIRAYARKIRDEQASSNTREMIIRSIQLASIVIGTVAGLSAILPEVFYDVILFISWMLALESIKHSDAYQYVIPSVLLITAAISIPMFIGLNISTSLLFAATAGFALLAGGLEVASRAMSASRLASEYDIAAKMDEVADARLANQVKFQVSQNAHDLDINSSARIQETLQNLERPASSRIPVERVRNSAVSFFYQLRNRSIYLDEASKASERGNKEPVVIREAAARMRA